MKSSNTKLKKYASVLNDAAPKGEFLAYINKDEAKLLKDNGGLGLLTDFGVPSYRFAGGYQGGSPGNTGGSRSSPSGGSSSPGGGGGRDSGAGGGGNDNAARAREQAAEKSRQEAAAKAARDRAEAEAAARTREEAARGKVQTPSEKLTDPGFVRALDEQARRQADPVYGDPDPYIDDPIEDRDTITSFLDNYRANVASNPFEFGLLGALKTAYQTSQAREMMRGTPGYEFLGSGLRDDTTPTGGGDSDSVITTTTTQPTTTTPTTTLPPSMVNQYFSNMGSMGNALSSNLQTDYNNAKNSINSILGIIPPSQQFGYSADPYGGLIASNLTTNPFNIDYLRRLGLI
jgi:hypothetical protein